MKITALKPQRKRGRFNLYLDDAFALGLDEGTLGEFRLKVGEEISQAAFEDLKRRASFGQLLERALSLLDYRPRSEWEMRQHLNYPPRRKTSLEAQVPSRPDPGLLTEVVEHLRSLGYLDDRQFVSWWLEQRGRFRPRGKFLLVKELLGKGISRELITEALAGYSAAEEIKQAKVLIARRRGKVRGVDPNIERTRLTAFLARRGFSFPVIRRALDAEGGADADSD